MSGAGRAGGSGLVMDSGMQSVNELAPWRLAPLLKSCSLLVVVGLVMQDHHRYGSVSVPFSLDVDRFRHSPRTARSCRSSCDRPGRRERSGPAGTPAAASVSGRGC